MEGVTILDTIIDSYRPDWAILIGVLGAVVMIIIGSVSSYILTDTSKRVKIILLIASVISIACVVVCLLTPKISITYYRVIADNTVNMNEFFQTYELIRTEGLIYVVKLIGV
jgi:hypothetical protein